MNFIHLLKDEFGEKLLSVVLYGSIARGEGRTQSDIDLLIVLEKPESNYHRRLDRILDLIERLRASKTYMKEVVRIGSEPYISFLVFSREEAQENRYLFLDMIDDAEILYDRNRFFANRLAEMKRRLQELGSRKIRLRDGTWFWDLKPDLKAGDQFVL